MGDAMYSFCTSCDGDVDRDECVIVDNNYECPECGEILDADSFDVIVQSTAPTGLTY